MYRTLGDRGWDCIVKVQKPGEKGGVFSGVFQQTLSLHFSMDFMSDFDMMLQRKKNLSGKRRRNRDGGTFISDADDVVSAMIVKMNEAAEVRFFYVPERSVKIHFCSLTK